MKITYGLKATILSLAGLTASMWQASERVHMLKNPELPLSCNLSPIVDCGTVLNHHLSALFGFPNAFIGIAVFGMLFALGMATIFGGVTKKIVPLMLVMASVIFGFSIWFFGASVFIIGKVCIFCVFIWLASMPLFVYTLREFMDGRSLTKSYLKTVRGILDKYSFAITLALYATLFLTFLCRFRNYYFS